MVVLAYLLTIPVMAALDLVWIGVLMKGFYQSRIGFLLSGQVQWGAAVAFYLLFVCGIFYFAVLPAYEVRLFSNVLISGALFGLIAYATYDLTNMATVAHWPLSVTLVDIAWGALLSAAVAATGYGLLVLLEG